MLSQIKAPSFLRTSAVFEKIVQFTVNPYVTGSSPVARAKDFPQDFHSLRDFVLFAARRNLVQI